MTHCVHCSSEPIVLFLHSGSARIQASPLLEVEAAQQRLDLVQIALEGDKEVCTSGTKVKPFRMCKTEN